MILQQLKMEAKFSKANIHAKLDELLDCEEKWLNKVSNKLKISTEDTRKIVKKVMFMQEWVTIPVLVIYIIKTRKCSYKRASKIAVKVAKLGIVRYKLTKHNIMIKCGLKNKKLKELKKGIIWHMYPPPMLVPPNRINSVGSSPYITKNMQFKLGLNDCFISHDVKDAIADVINSLNEIPLRLDPFIMQCDEHEFKPKKKKFKQFHKEVEKHKKIYKYYADKEFYLLWKVDKRLRMYCAGNAINVQGYDYKRALINSAEEEVLTERGLYWLKIAACNAFDEMVGNTAMSKRTYEERLEWTEKYIDSVDWRKADKPFMFKKLRHYIHKGVGYSSGVMVEFDSSSSGSQILSTIAGCKGGMKLCNLGTNDSKYIDAPMYILKKFNKLSDSKIKVDRKKMKYAYMTFLYGSKRKPEQLFGNQVWLFIKTVNDAAPKMYKLYEKLMEIATRYTTGYTIYTPDCSFKIPTYEPTQKHYYSEFFNRNIITYMDSNEPKSRDVSFVANFVAAHDAYVVREMIRQSRFDIIPIHDAYLVSPNHVDELMEEYADILLYLNKLNGLKDTLKYNRAGKFKCKRLKKLFNKYALS